MTDRPMTDRSLTNRIENRTFKELAIGDSDTYSRALTPQDFERFAEAAGELDPIAVESGLATTNGFQAIAARSGWGAALVAAVVAGRFPGAGTEFIGQTLETKGKTAPGDVVTLVLTVKSKAPEGRRVALDCRGVNQRGEPILSGVVEVSAPSEKITRRRMRGAGGEVHEKGRRYRRLLEMTRGLPPLKTAVVHPVDEASLVGAVEAAREGLIEAILIGPEAKIRRAAEESKVDLSPFEIVSTEHSHAAAQAAVAMARSGAAEALMKGALHTDELMRAVVDPNLGLRTARRITHVFAIDAPTYPRALFITDAAVNIYPTLMDKRDIVQNAIDLTRALGVVTPTWRSSPRSRRSRRTSNRRSTPRRCARWPTAARSSAASSTARSLSTTRCRRRRRAPRESSRRWRGAPTSSSRPISRPATCSPSSSNTSPTPKWPASCSAPACR